MAGQSYNNLNNINNIERVSEEELGNTYACPENENDVLEELGFDLFEDLLSQFNFSDEERKVFVFQESSPATLQPSEHNLGNGPANHQVSLLEQDHHRALNNGSTMRTVARAQKRQSTAKRVPLSHSVGVNQSQILANMFRQLLIVHALEEFYRPRYKSDYFAQNGRIRPPRYVSDRIGGHFVTLKVPIGLSGAIRVDWLTVPDERGDRYWMPYKFQESNEDETIPDCNPKYVNVTADGSRTMKLYLVLIKSKQGVLRSAQPLLPFQPYRDALGEWTKPLVHQPAPMGPKELIKKYQLEKSQLAFTYCSLNADGSSWIPEWDTTAYSTVLTEAQMDSPKRRAVACPRCDTVIQLPTATETGDDDDNDGDNEADAGIQFTGVGKRKNQR